MVCNLKYVENIKMEGVVVVALEVAKGVCMNTYSNAKNICNQEYGHLKPSRKSHKKRLLLYHI